MRDRLFRSFGAFPIGVLLALLFLLLGGCEYPTESIRVFSVHCVAGDTVYLPADDSTDVMLPCIDPRDLPSDSLTELP